MKTSMSRRQFLQQSSVLGAGLAALGPAAVGRGADSPGRKVVLGFMGVNGRGTDLIKGFTALPGVEVAYVCDVDERAVAKGIRAATVRQPTAPKGVKDFRRVLDDRDVDALVIATPDHWHAAATILACAAGKHVYVEKPACHNPHEGELMVAAARKYRRSVQLGTQRRSMPGILEAIERLRGGALGRVLFARAWYTATRPSISHGKVAPVPAWLDYSLWEGPAPERPYRDNLIHYNWHWFWHWGTGELGNNGVHALDVCRWGLGVDCPTRVSAGGGKYRWDDDQETPDTQVVTFDFGRSSIVYEGRSWSHRGFEGSMFGLAFYGEQGSLVSDGSSYIIYDAQDKELTRVRGSGSAAPHFENFLNAIRRRDRLNAEIEEGYQSTLLCLLGNIASRTGHTLHLDPRRRQIVGDPAATALWRRTYRPGWEPRV
ncbi:MAG: Gfo/Idh/MocA family oxidoreductase [Verrucomicrobia bacterium]|nr:Gfo/Idh/MocA family oxidoreductase [Verrucomicrobiota bacterium]